MSERERWIVYPLLFFALGAALRDKFTHSVRTDHLYAQKVSCEELEVNSAMAGTMAVVDPKNPQRKLAILTSADARLPDGRSQRLGSLVLTDSDGREVFWLVDDQVRTRQITCERIAVIDPENERTLAELGSGMAKGADGKPQRVGVLSLNGQPFTSVRGKPLPQEDR
jgi:hypothetical protein